MTEESLIDLKIAFKLYWDHRKEYILTFLVFMLGIFVLVIISMIILVKILSDGFSQLNELTGIIFVLFMVIACCVFFLLLAYARTIFGLTYDIMTSGELFTEFKRSITYFKRFWIYFSFFSIPFALIIFLDQLIGLFFILQFINTNKDYRPFLIPIKFFVYLFDFSLYILFIETLPSMMVVKKLRQNIKENFRILQSNFGRIFRSIGLYYIIFRGSMFIIDITRLILVDNVGTFLLFNLIFLVVTVVNGVIGLPILSLISTRIYNTTMIDE